VGPDGKEEAVAATFIVGADGVASAVRAAAAIPGTPSPRPHFSYLADVRLEGPGLEGVLSAAHAFLGAGMGLAIPLDRPGWARLVFDGPPASATGGARPPPLDAAGVRALFAASMPFSAERVAREGGKAVRKPSTLAGAALGVAEVGWASAFRVVEYCAPTFRAGRVFLVGDAAHAHSPAGGQGLNLGVQDGVNLGWKLGLVLGGGGGAVPNPEPLLDSFSAERRPVAAVRVKNTGRAWRALVETKAPLLVGVRNALIRAVGSRPALVARLSRAAGPTITMLGVAYPPDGRVLVDEGGGGLFDPASLGPGGRAPLAVGGLAARLEGAGGHLLVAWGQAGGGPADHAAAALPWAELWPDPPPALITALGGDPSTPAAVVIRPDGVIGWRGSGVEGALAWWGRLVGAE